jgi:hypothetical protein
MICRMVRYKSTLKDDGQESPDGDLIEPPGRVHAELLFEKLKDVLTKLRAPWNEEDYAWEFIGKFSGVSISIITSNYEGNQIQTLISAFSPFAWLFRQHSENAVADLSKVVSDRLASDPRFTDIHIFTDNEVRIVWAF